MFSRLLSCTLQCPDYLVVNRSCARCTSAAPLGVNTLPRYCPVRSSLSIITLQRFTKLWLGVNENSSRCDEVLDNVYKCDSDIEGDEASESIDENKSVRTQRSTHRLLSFERALKWVSPALSRDGRSPPEFSMLVHGKRESSDVPLDRKSVV